MWILLPVSFRALGGPGWWEGAACALVLLVPMTLFAGWAAWRRPEFLARRARYREDRPAQRRLLWVANPLVLTGTLVLPGLDHRFGWSAVPDALAVAALAVVAVSSLAVLGVFVANPWASRDVSVTPEQRVVDAGPYAIVRHPMYTAVAALFAATPIAPGCWWGLPFGLALVPVLVVRIADEEALRVEALPGCAAYRDRVRWRLLPGVW